MSELIERPITQAETESGILSRIIAALFGGPNGAPQPEPSFLERLHGERFGNIDLPMDPYSQADPKLQGTRVRDAVNTAAQGFKELQKRGILGSVK